jgi:hypothetical protein
VSEPAFPNTVGEFADRLLEQLPHGTTGRLTHRGEAKHVLLIMFPAGGGTFRVTVEDAAAARAADDRGRLRKRRPRP